MNDFKSNIIDCIEHKDFKGVEKWFSKAQQEIDARAFLQLSYSILDDFFSVHDFDTPEKIKNAFKNEVLILIYESQIVSYKKQQETELKKFLTDYLWSEAEQFYEKECNLLERSEYEHLLNDSKKKQNEEQIELEKEKQEQLVLLKAKEEFAELAKKFNMNINKVVDNVGRPTELALILIKLEEKSNLSESELKWLEMNKAFELLANYYYQFSKSFPGNGAWSLSKASKFFIKAHMLQKAIEITDGFSERSTLDLRADSAVYTSRGAAFRRLPNLDEAKKCANEAISLSPTSFQPYNLLGGISYDEGDIEGGTKYFEKANKLGSSEMAQEAEIRSATKEERKRIIDYLLQKNPEKYAWVKKFQLP